MYKNNSYYLHFRVMQLGSICYSNTMIITSKTVSKSSLIHMWWFPIAYLGPGCSVYCCRNLLAWRGHPTVYRPTGQKVWVVMKLFNQCVKHNLHTYVRSQEIKQLDTYYMYVHNLPINKRATFHSISFFFAKGNKIPQYIRKWFQLKKNSD